MKFKPTNIKGAFDSAPREQVLRNRVLSVLRQNFEAYGYLPLETPQLNYLELLTYKYDGDAEIVNEIYKLRDQGERDLGLRFDLTVPFCKFIAMNRNMKMPFKRYEIGKVFRNGPVKAGRVREFYQCDVDAVGISGAHIEAELMALCVKCYLELGIEPIIQYGNRKFLTQMIKDSGAAASDTDKVIGIVDKMAKITRETLLTELSKYITKENAVRLIDKLTDKKTTCDDVTELSNILKELGIAQYCLFAPYLARGLNYYTGTVWEVFAKDGTITSSLGGGGRYDKIIGNFIDNGTEYPAVGMSFGLEPIIAVLSAEGDTTCCTDLMIVPMGCESYSQKFADTLRAKGQRVLVYLGGKNVSKAFEYADANNIPYVAVIGENEIKSGTVKVKNMKTGQSEDLKV